MFNALYWSSQTWNHADTPVRVKGELYHAHPIPGEDTASIRVETSGGTQIIYNVTLAGWEARGPLTRLEGTKATAWWDHLGDTTIEYNDGTSETIAWDKQREHDEVFRNAIRYLRGESDELHAPIAMTRPMTVALNGAYEFRRAASRDPGGVRHARGPRREGLHRHQRHPGAAGSLLRGGHHLRRGRRAVGPGAGVVRHEQVLGVQDRILRSGLLSSVGQASSLSVVHWRHR